MRVDLPYLAAIPLVTLLVAAGCGSEPSSSEGGEKQAPEAPHLADPGKADAPGAHVAPLGNLTFGGEVHGEFVEDGQLDGYLFAAESGAHITLDNSNLETSRSLDSTLFLYGPANQGGFFGADPIAMDDDSGWGPHARIKDFVLPARGQYLAVIGTYAQQGRGRYRLALLCEQESCVVHCDDDCDDGDPLTTDTCDPVQGCMHESTSIAYGNVILDGAAGTLVTKEDRSTATFSVHLKEAPTENMILWVSTSDATEGEPYPTKLLFCKPGFHVGSYGCTDEQPGDPDEWKQTTDVTVFGVRDQLADGDVAYQISLRMEMGDVVQSNNLVDIPCVNQDVDQDAGQGVDGKPDYSDLEGLTDDDLLRAIFARIGGHVAYGYQGQNSARTIMFSIIDEHDGVVESLYTGETVPRPLDAPRAYMEGFNTEHTWPQSQFDKLEPMKSDLHHVFPCDMESNHARASYDYGWTTKPQSPSSALGTSATDASKVVYQVRPEVRGDVARAHFYMVARYKFDTTTEIAFDDDDSLKNGCIRDDEEAVLRAWNVEDPVDERERDRNNRVEAYQGNRNPFVDEPELADAISDF